jgi:hypothetical protein
MFRFGLNRLDVRRECRSEIGGYYARKYFVPEHFNFLMLAVRQIEAASERFAG